MKYIKGYNENSSSFTFEEFKSNLKEQNSEINDLISKIPIDLLLKAKKDLEKLNINVIIKKIYNFRELYTYLTLLNLKFNISPVLASIKR